MATIQSRDWRHPGSDLPVDGQEVDTMNSRGQVSRLVYDKGLWWLPDRSMYVYYTPTFWKAP